MKKLHISRKSTKSNLLLIAVVAVVIITVFSVLWGSARYEKSKNVKCDYATFDLSDIDFDGGQNAYLTGDWEFYYNTLLIQDDVKSAQLSSYLSVPSPWSSVIDKGGKYKSGGYASYRCVIKNVSAEEPLTVYVPNIACAYNVYVNRVLVTSSGVVSKDTEEIWAETEHSSIPFSLNGSHECEIIIEVAAQNYSGLYMPVLIADYEHDDNRVDTMTGLKFAFCGIVAFCCLLFIIFKKFIDTDLYSIWLPVLSFILFLRMIMTSEVYAVTQPVFGGMSYEIMTLFIFVSTFIIKLVALMYLIKFVNIKVSENAIVAFSAAFLIIAVIINFLPNSVFDVYYFAVLQVFSSIIDIYIINKLCIEIVNKTENSLLYLLSYLFVVVGITVDALYQNGFIETRFSSFMPICFFIFVAFTAVIHALRMRKIYMYAVKSQQLVRELEQANMSIMLSQIQPHFLYNALNTIKSLIRRDPQKAERAVIDFSLYLRGNMDSLTKTEPIPFSEELEHVKYYCNIEKLRFGDKLDIFYEIGPDSFFVPTLSVQPIVENAIKHGVTKKAKGGCVTVSTFEDETNYYITVEDDGVGFNVNENFEKSDDSRSHVGIKNITERFKTVMGASVKIDSAEGVGTTVTVCLPKKRNVKTLKEGLEFQKYNEIGEMKL